MALWALLLAPVSFTTAFWVCLKLRSAELKKILIPGLAVVLM